MIHLILSVMAALTLNLAASAQEPECKKCGLPPQAIGKGGITCEDAEAAYNHGSGAKASYYFEDSFVTYTLRSEVYCKPRYGYTFLGGVSPTLTFTTLERFNPLNQDPEWATTVRMSGIMGYSYLASDSKDVLFDRHGDACFSRWQLEYDRYYGWQIPQRPMHYFSYQCRIPPKNEYGLICKVRLDDKIDIGYQIYTNSDSYDSIREGILR